jgi:DNA-binding response OmpR family regulator
VILLDMRLPDGSGLELIDHLAGSDALSAVPVVVLSGDGPQVDPRNARVAEWLTKPFAEQELVRAIRAAAGGSGESRTRESP